MMPVSMVGRAGELAEFAAAWAMVTGGRPRTGCVVVTGAAGVGKSLLISAALDGLSPRPVTILSGTARVHTPAPYDWLAAALSGRDTGDLPLPPDALAWLAQHPNAPRERYAPDALLRLAVRTVRALVGAGPAVLVVEDLHALDPASLNLVGELATAPDLPALLLVGSRPAEEAVSPRLVAATLARLSGAPGAIRQHLGPLGRPDVAAVLGQVYPGPPVPPTVVDAVWRRTGGNPYRLVELLVAERGRRPEELVAPAPTAELTGREIEVLSCLAAGMSNKQVARSLGISVRTVTVHVSNLLRKTGSASRTEAALWAVRQQLTDPARQG
ncbi:MULTISPECIES: AAA family ATPase [unclassified Plantactinospora]|uniref:AAA family ATPase n=1 Tax=unclassified Plantactinospora TaxID=2631981 RepID=UPI000D174D10|nr:MULTISPECIES: AAA family ATPase [unclassified Plantactinospora]AVT31108.1 LuxR family transcriptional regulator [Plantactinospora sp. BC1]AVT39652.1 LuxR family transcriptional regulator [Plantactinospora sp. BB1]